MAAQITPNEAVALCDNYDNKYDTITKLINTDDNRSCSFSILELEEYLAYLKASNKDIDGIRIYLGSDNTTSLTTMFMVPTSKNTDNTSLNVLNRFNPGKPPKKKYIK